MNNLYLKKFHELICKGWKIKDIIQNLYINYSAIQLNDEIYEIKKSIAEKFNCNLSCVQLIGSSRTGFKIDEFNKLVECNPLDYDFCIISSLVFSDILFRVKVNAIKKEILNNFNSNLSNGKIHIKYVDKDLKEYFFNFCYDIETKLSIKKKITLCIYLDEKYFVKGLIKYFKNYYFYYLKEKSKSVSISDNLNTEIMVLDKMEE